MTCTLLYFTSQSMNTRPIRKVESSVIHGGRLVLHPHFRLGFHFGPIWVPSTEKKTLYFKQNTRKMPPDKYLGHSIDTGGSIRGQSSHTKLTK